MNNDFNNEQYEEQRFYGQQDNPPPMADPKGESAKTLGIIALVCLFVCQIASIICGAIAVSHAKQSRMMLNVETDGAKTGRICGLVALILGILSTVFYLLYIVLLIVMSALMTLPPLM